MADLQQDFEEYGNWLFAHRSSVPAILLVLYAAAFSDFEYVGDSSQAHHIWAVLCLLVSLSGLAVRALVVGFSPCRTSGRNTREQIADTLNTDGMYSVVRHPLYWGNFLIWLGITAYFSNGWLCALYLGLFLLYYERIAFAEEQFLKRRFEKRFIRWAAVTPVLLPSLSNWQRPALEFSWRNVLKREYTALLGIFAAFALLDLAAHAKFERTISIDRFWLVSVALAALCFTCLRWLKRCTTVLNVAGR